MSTHGFPLRLHKLSFHLQYKNILAVPSSFTKGPKAMPIWKMHYLRFTAFAALAAAILLALNTASAAPAEDAKTQWEKTNSILLKNSGQVAARITTEFEMPDDDGVRKGAYITLMERAAIDGVPKRPLYEPSPNGDFGIKMAALNFGVAEALANQPEILFHMIESVESGGRVEIDGVACEILAITSRTRSGQKPVTARVCTDPTSGAPRQVDAIVHGTPLPGVSRVTMKITYGLDRGFSLPRSVSVSYPIAIFFHRGHVTFSHTLESWRSRDE